MRQTTKNLLLQAIGFFLTELSVYLCSISSLVRSALNSTTLSKTAAVVAITSLASLVAYFAQKLDAKGKMAQETSIVLLICASALLSLQLAFLSFGSVLWFVFIFFKMIVGHLIPAYLLAAVEAVPGADEIKINKWMQSGSSAAFLFAMAMSPSLALFLNAKHFFILDAFLILSAGYLLYIRKSEVEMDGRNTALVEPKTPHAQHQSQALYRDQSVIEVANYKKVFSSDNLESNFLILSVFLVYFVFGIFNVIEIPYLQNQIQTTVSELSVVLFVTGMANLFAVFILPDALLKKYSKEIFAGAAVLLLSLIYFYSKTKNLAEVIVVVILIGSLNSFVTVAKTSIVQLRVDRIKKASGFLALRLAANLGLCLSTLLFLKVANIEDLQRPLFFSAAISASIIGLIYFVNYFKTLFRKLFSKQIAACLGALVIFGASDNSHAAELRVPIPNNLQIFDPAQAFDTSSALILNQVFDNLYLYTKSNSLKPHLVASHSISTDARVFQIQLNPKATFSDGSGLTAKDVANSIERAAFFLKDQSAWALGEVDGFSEFVKSPQQGKMRGIKVISNLEIQFTLQRPFRQFLQTLAAPYFAIVKESKSGLIGTGAYVLDVKGENSTRLVLRPNSVSLPGQPTSLNFIVSPRKEDYLQMLDANKVDLAETQVSNELNGDFEVQKIDYIQNVILIFNSKRPQFKNAEARIQFALAFKEALKNEKIYLSSIDEGVAFAGSGLLNLTGTRRKGDGKISTQVLYFDSAGSFTTDRIDRTARVLSKNGYRTNFDRLSIKELFKNVGGMSFDAAMIGFVPDYLDLDAILTPLLKTGQQYNFAKYSNPLLDQLLDLGRSIDEKKARLSVYAKAADVILRDTPIAFLGSQGSYLYHSKNWKIPPVTGMGLHMIKFQNARYNGPENASENAKTSTK